MPRKKTLRIVTATVFFLVSVTLLALIPAASVQAQSVTIIHVVKPGETLAQIAREYGVNYKRLAQYNGLRNPNLIRPGQRLRIPQQILAPPASFMFQSGSPLVSSSPEPTATADAVSAAGFSSTVPESLIADLSTPSAEMRVEPQMPAATTTCRSDVLYRVRYGDTLGEIGIYFNVSIADIIGRNRLPTPMIYVGQTLIIPTVVCK